MSDTAIYVLPKTEDKDIEAYVVEAIIDEFKTRRAELTKSYPNEYVTPIERLIDVQVRLLLINTELLGTSDLYSECSEKDSFFSDIWLDSTAVTKALSSVCHMITPIIERSLEMMLDINDSENKEHLKTLEDTSLEIADRYVQKYPDLQEPINQLIEHFSDDVLPPVD